MAKTQLKIVSDRLIEVRAERKELKESYEFALEMHEHAKAQNILNVLSPLNKEFNELLKEEFRLKQ